MAEEEEKTESYEERAKREAGPPVEPKVVEVEDDSPDPEAWMVTFSDLLTLLMTFFVLMFASADPVKSKYFEAFGQSQGVFGLFRTSFFEKITAVKRRDISQDRLEIFLDNIGSKDSEVKQEERGLVITLPSGTLFGPGEAVLNQKALVRLAKIGKLLKFTEHAIRVEGHTDNREARRSSFGSSWELSVARANAVLRLFLKQGLEAKRLSLTGYGPSRPRFANESRRGRERNRRVEIIIINRGESPLEG